MIKLIDIFRLVFAYMIEKKSRVFLTISGIIIGIFTFTFFIFLSQGLSNAISAQFNGLGVNVLGVQPITGTTTGVPTGEGLTDTDIAKIKQVISNYKYIAPAVYYTGLFSYGRYNAVVSAVGFPAADWHEISQDMGLHAQSGRIIRAGDTNVVVLGSNVAKNSFGKNNPVGVGSSLTVNNQTFRVIGVLKPTGTLFVDNSLIMALKDVKQLSGQSTYSMIRISFKDGTNLDQMQTAIENKLNPNPNNKVIKITSSKQVMQQFNQILGVLTLIISFISSIALIVGGINVMNTMYANVIERQNEISVMKAIGATNKDILKIFVIESSFLGFIGALIGFLLSYGLAELLSFLITTGLGYDVPVFFDLTFFLEVIIITTVFAIIFGVYPAIRASRIKPADNLRDE